MTQLLLLALAIIGIVIGTTRFRLHPFLALLLAAFGYGLLAGMPAAEVVESVNLGFGGTLGHIGVVIICGTIIGVFLERSGATQSLAESALRLTGRNNVPLAMGSVGYVVSLPVFCDAAFVLLAPLNRALSTRAGMPVAAGAVALSLGLYATHTMVPPTPGPIAAAGILGADLGRVILFGLAVSLVALAAGWLFATRFAVNVELMNGRVPERVPASADTWRPPTRLSVLPILLPILLIVVQSVAQYPGTPLGESRAVNALIFLGQPVVALLIGALLAFLLPRRADPQRLSANGWLGDAIVAAAPILAITGAGGAFGKVLQNSGIAEGAGSLAGDSRFEIWLPFLIAAVIKTAQGSSTVAIITTAGIVAPLASALGLDSEAARALTVVAIGAGAMVVSHANDSYFWVVTQFSGMNMSEGLRLHTLGTLIEGIAAACAVWLLSLLLL
ncbi:GntP family permease [gamma proteobacterium NOR5-3]|nr:GntP family permease [gamma proteobacterium NOR5-3]